MTRSRQFYGSCVTPVASIACNHARCACGFDAASRAERRQRHRCTCQYFHEIDTQYGLHTTHIGYIRHDFVAFVPLAPVEYIYVAIIMIAQYSTNRAVQATASATATGGRSGTHAPGLEPGALQGQQFNHAPGNATEQVQAAHGFSPATVAPRRPIGRYGLLTGPGRPIPCRTGHRISSAFPRASRPWCTPIQSLIEPIG